MNGSDNMCGIVGYLGHRNPSEVIIKGLKRLEYRGYDSAGIALYSGDGIITEKCSQSLEIFNYCDKLGFIDYIQKQLKRYSKLLPINIHFSVYTTHQYSKIIAEKDGRAIETVIVLDTYVDRQQMRKLDYTKLSKVTKKDGLKFLSKTFFKKVENRQLIYM